MNKIGISMVVVLLLLGSVLAGDADVCLRDAFLRKIICSNLTIITDWLGE